MKAELRPSKAVEIELQLKTEMGELSGVVRTRRRRKLDLLGMIVGTIAAALTLSGPACWILARLADVTKFDLVHISNPGNGFFLIVFGVTAAVLLVMGAFVSGRVWVSVASPPMAFFISPDRVVLGDNRSSWSMVRDISAKTSGLEDSRLTVSLAGAPPTVLTGSREAIHWLQDVMVFYQQEALGDGQGVPEELGTIRHRPAEDTLKD